MVTAHDLPRTPFFNLMGIYHKRFDLFFTMGRNMRLTDVGRRELIPQIAGYSRAGPKKGPTPGEDQAPQ